MDNETKVARLERRVVELENRLVNEFFTGEDINGALHFDEGAGVVHNVLLLRDFVGFDLLTAKNRFDSECESRGIVFPWYKPNSLGALVKEALERV